MIAQYEAELNFLKELSDIERNSDENQTKKDRIVKQMGVLNKLRNIEIGFELKKLKIEKAAIISAIGRTKLEQASVKRNATILTNQNQINKLTQERDQLGKDGIQFDEKKREELQLQLDILQGQNTALARQGDMVASIYDAGRQAFETSMSGAISKFLKGEESSIKTLFIGIANSMVDAMIDEFAKFATEKLMSFIPGYKTQGQKMEAHVLAGAKLGVEQGATTISTEIDTAMSKGVADFAKALDDAAGRFADAIREACHTCSCSGGVMPTPTTSSADVYAKSMGSDDFRSKIPPLETPLSRTIPSDMSVTTSDGVSTQTAVSNRDGISVETQMQRNAELEEAQLKEINIRKEGNTSLFDVYDGMKTPNKTSGEGGGLIIPTTTIKNGKKPGADESLPGGEEFIGGLGEEFEKQTNGSGGFLSSMGGLFGGLGDALGGLLGGGGGGGGAGGLISTVISSFFAKGGVAQGGFRKYANGGIATRPHLGLVGEGRMNEAIVPLPDGKSIPVSMPKNAGGGMQNNNVGVTVNIDKNGQASTNTESDSQAAAKMGEAIANAVQEELLNQKRNGGILSPYGVG